MQETEPTAPRYAQSLLFSAFFTYATPAPKHTCNTISTDSIHSRSPRTHLARRNIRRHERDLRLALVPLRLRRPDLPDGRLERVARLHGRGEAHPEQGQRTRVPAADGGDDRARAEAERREPVQDHAAETCRRADRRVYHGCQHICREGCRGKENHGRGERGGRERVRTDVELVVVAAEAVDDGLLGRRLVAHDPVGLAVLRRGRCLRRAPDALREI